MHNLSRRKTRAQPDMPISAPAKDERSATSVDQHVGKRIARQRRELGLPVTQLAAQLGVSYQQVYKYEQGTNRITSGQLYIIAQMFGVGIGWFFEDIAGALSVPEDSLPVNQMQDLANNFAAISNEMHKEAFAQLVRVIADAEGNSARRPQSKPLVVSASPPPQSFNKAL